ncbi:MAG: type II CRISPR-associated endonuclease Cas1 [Acidobacteria bacterium]|nr:type II CRISPR-associated endonuclease Cas1 [Acidobacteriota bacterium]
MIKRTVEISTDGCHVHTKLDQLLIDKDGETIGTVPVEDLGMLIIDSYRMTITSSAMRLLSEKNVAVVFTDSKHLPASITIPFSSHTIQTKILNEQVAVSLPVKKRLWAAVVSSKIANQAQALEICGKDGTSLREVSRRVKSGDAGNLEAFAAKQYWKKLLGDGFKRDREAMDSNVLLNYGYAIVRAATTRAIVGTGLHPGFGINHKNQYNPFPLADDLMEPLRPFVDVRVHRLLNGSATGNEPENCTLDRRTKQELLNLLGDDCKYDGRKLPLLVALGYYAASVKQIMMGESQKPLIPEL